MGEHKHNPNCELAKSGQLPPKPKKMSKRERDRWLMSEIKKHTGLDRLYQFIDGINYQW